MKLEREEQDSQNPISKNKSWICKGKNRKDMTLYWKYIKKLGREEQENHNPLLYVKGRLVKKLWREEQESHDPL